MCSSVLGQDRNAQGGRSLESELVAKKIPLPCKTLEAGSEGPCVQLLQLLSLQGIKPQSTEATLALSHHIVNDSRSAVSPSLLHRPPCHPYFAIPALSPSLTCFKEALNQQQDSEQGQFCDTVSLITQRSERRSVCSMGSQTCLFSLLLLLCTT